MPQGAPEQYELTDDQLRQLLSDPLFGPQHVQKMTPSEQQRLAALKRGELQPQAAGAESPGRIERIQNTVADVGLGAAKGLGETTTNAVGLVPGVTSITNKLGNILGGKAAELMYGEESVTPPVSQASVTRSLEATNPAQKAGKFAEQTAEFFVPAGGVRKEMMKLLAPSASSSPLIQRLMGSLGRTSGEAISAGAVSGLHGQEDPEVEAGLAGALTAAREIAPLLGPLLRFPLVQHLVTSALIGGAGSGGAALGGVVGGAGGIGAGMGAYNAIRRVLANAAQRANAMRAPKVTPFTGAGARTAASISETAREDK